MDELAHHSNKVASATTDYDWLDQYIPASPPVELGYTSANPDGVFTLDDVDDHDFGVLVLPDINNNQHTHHYCPYTDAGVPPDDASSYTTDPCLFTASDPLSALSSLFSHDSSPHSQPQPWDKSGSPHDSWQQNLEPSSDLWNSRLPESETQLLPTAWSGTGTEPAIVSAPGSVEDSNRLPPKIGGRFSRESVQILKKWLALNSRHPYLSDEDHAMLQRQTGLSKTQISNWLTNARRKRNAQAKRSAFADTRKTSAGPIDVLARPDTPAIRSSPYGIDPLRRWVDSPPEDEPATVLAIARAIASDREGSSGLNRRCSSASTGEGSDRSLNGSGSAASSVYADSGSSLTSARSQASDASFSPFRRVYRFHDSRRRSRKRATPKHEGESSFITALKPYQCTFCTEAFKTKHDWQRHEKSMHLSLELWTCAPDGNLVIKPGTNQICCVFCGRVDPDDVHTESHHHSACRARAPEDRTFYRKDHLNQHLRLVHDVSFLDWSMKPWKTSVGMVRSRCGFCGIVMNSWSMRVEHLAGHFKIGKTLADWKGDWGFEAPVLDMLRNAIPPYLIEMERSSPFPFVASSAPVESPRTGYELITLELGYFINNYTDEQGHLPNDELLRFEACRIIFASESLSLDRSTTTRSWLRELLMASEKLATQARFAPLRRGVENKLCALQINGKNNLFEQCPLEQQLEMFVLDKALRDSTTVTVQELQKEACRIIGRAEESALTHSEVVANWLVRLIMSSTTWLVSFCERANLPKPQFQDMVGLDMSCSGEATQMTSNMNSHGRLEQSLGRYIENQRASGIDPSDEDLGREARRIISGLDSSWNPTTAADNTAWLTAFKSHHTQGGPGSMIDQISNASATITAKTQPPDLDLSGGGPLQTIPQDPPNRNPGAFASMMKKTFFLNDTNCYRHVAQELTRFVKSTMSPNNPKRHVPTDAELQYQARWILFESDDPWNQTAADNQEWLQRFKRDVGIFPPDPCQWQA